MIDSDTKGVKLVAGFEVEFPRRQAMLTIRERRPLKPDGTFYGEYAVEYDGPIEECEEYRLKAENARLRSCLSDDAENARQILGENEQLRELVKDMHRVMWACRETECPHREHGCLRVKGNGDGECWFEQRMRELGVEVD